MFKCINWWLRWRYGNLLLKGKLGVNFIVFINIRGVIFFVVFVIVSIIFVIISGEVMGKMVFMMVLIFVVFKV